MEVRTTTGHTYNGLMAAKSKGEGRGVDRKIFVRLSTVSDERLKTEQYINKDCCKNQIRNLHLLEPVNSVNANCSCGILSCYRLM